MVEAVNEYRETDDQNKQQAGDDVVDDSSILVPLEIEQVDSCAHGKQQVRFVDEVERFVEEKVVCEFDLDWQVLL